MIRLMIALLPAVCCVFAACSRTRPYVQTVTGVERPSSDAVWLTHEHVLVDFSGADSIASHSEAHDLIVKEMLPYLSVLKTHGVAYFVDATPAFLGRDALLLRRLSQMTGLKIITNTGLYGARNNLFVPQWAKDMSAEELAETWIDEFENGIEGTAVKPGFIKIGVDAADSLHPLHQRLVKAAALTHLKTGLVIASHTGEAKALWPQLRILQESGVSPEAFIWVHAQGEGDRDAYLKAAALGCWISLDGIGWEWESYVERILFAKQNGILDRILLSHDAGWFDPKKETQSITPFTNLFENLLPALKARGLSDEEVRRLICVNPGLAFSIKVRRTSERHAGD